MRPSMPPITELGRYSFWSNGIMVRKIFPKTRRRESRQKIITAVIYVLLFVFDGLLNNFS